MSEWRSDVLKTWDCTPAVKHFCTVPASRLPFNWRNKHSADVGAAFYFTVPIVWFLMEHHALNTSLRSRSIKRGNVCLWFWRIWKHLVSKIVEKVLDVYTPAVCGHAFIAAVFFVPVFALHCWVIAASPDTHTPHRCGITGAVHLHLLLKNRVRWAYWWNFTALTCIILWMPGGLFQSVWTLHWRNLTQHWLFLCKSVNIDTCFFSLPRDIQWQSFTNVVCMDMYSQLNYPFCDLEWICFPSIHPFSVNSHFILIRVTGGCWSQSL